MIKKTVLKHLIFDVKSSGIGKEKVARRPFENPNMTNDFHTNSNS
jgi:hypothetical protein